MLQKTPEAVHFSKLYRDILHGLPDALQDIFTTYRRDRSWIGRHFWVRSDGVRYVTNDIDEMMQKQTIDVLVEAHAIYQKELDALRAENAELRRQCCRFGETP